MSDQPVVVVTGGGGGIGAAVAEELGRGGWFVVTVDPLVSLDGSEQLPTPEETTAGRIVAAGGSAQASGASVTDGPAVQELFEELVREHGRLDAVVNVAGISRPTSFAKGTEADWRAVLTVHLDGYLNVLRAALPIMAAAGRGRILGVTSGSGWRQADTGAYGCAKRAVAALTWQVGRHAPPGVTVNAMSPIAVTRMVTAALSGATARSGTSSATGGLALGSMPEPKELGPMGAYLVSEDSSWCSGEVIFVGGSEVAVIRRGQLLEAVDTDGQASLSHTLEAATAEALAPAEANQTSGGGSNPRLAPILEERATSEVPPSEVQTCAIVTDHPQVGERLIAALEARGVSCKIASPGEPGFRAAASTLSSLGPLDAVVVALAGQPSVAGGGWERILAEHADIVERVHVDASWVRATADHAAEHDRSVRLVTLTDAVTTGGRSRAQASAQLARSARRATGDRVSAFPISVEAPSLDSIGAIVAHLVCSPEAPALSGAELVVGPGWFGLRSHPRPSGSISLAGPHVPDWLDGALRSITGKEDA